MNKKSIGFTGTQTGMNRYQIMTMHKFLVSMNKHGFDTFEHGDCIGADADAHKIAKLNNYKIILHPPINPDKRAYCEDEYEMKDEKKYIERNHNIVDATNILIATPHGDTEIKRGSGTWATIRYAKKQNKNIIIIFPNKTEILK